MYQPKTPEGKFAQEVFTLLCQLLELNLGKVGIAKRVMARGLISQKDFLVEDLESDEKGRKTLREILDIARKYLPQ